jgi:hypothetical protein
VALNVAFSNSRTKDPGMEQWLEATGQKECESVKAAKESFLEK